MLGTISANHQLSSRFPGPEGIKVENKIHINIEFKERATVKDTVDAVYTLLQFLEIIAGRRQTVLRLEFMIPGAEDRLCPLDVYCSMSPPRGDDASERGPHPADLPIQAAREPLYFANVLTEWLARDQEWRSARFRFSSAFALQTSFTIDRLVGAANMFDILPASAVPSVAPLTKDIEDAKARSRALFKSLPPTPARDSVLNALGRLGKASLKMKVRARAALILNRLPTRFLELELVVDEAVDCRNFFVHGSKAKMDYNENFDQVSFFTEALEFIFAASDLIECGWDIEGWTKQASLISHPFARFHMNYQSCLENLKRALAAVKPAVKLSVGPP